MKKNWTIFILSSALCFLGGAFFWSTKETGSIVRAESLDTTGFQQFQDQFRRVAAENLPVVVEIDVLNRKEAGQEMEESIPWDDFFSTPDSSVPRDKFDFYGLGSGVILKKKDSTYYVVTNYHVIGDSEQIQITLHNGMVKEAKPVGVDPRKDLALLSFKSEDILPIARLGRSSDLYVGDWVLAIGNPLGYESSVTAGIISALGREEGPGGNISDFIQTDASINQGNSGGALVNMDGEVVGINTWISTSTGGSMGLGFSLPIDNVIGSVEDLIAFGKPQYGWLGVSMGDFSSSMKKSLAIPIEASGAFVYQVFIGSPAWRGGIRAGDFIHSIDGKEVKNRKELTYLIGEIEPGKTLPFGIYRNGSKTTRDVTIDIRDEEDAILTKNSLAWPGIMVLPMNDTVREALSLSKEFTGVLVEDVYGKTAFQKAGVQIGDNIYKVNGETIENLNDFYNVIGELSGNLFTLSIKRLSENIQAIEIVVEREN